MLALYKVRLQCRFPSLWKMEETSEELPNFSLGKFGERCASSNSLIFRTLQTPACIHNSINTHAKHERILKLQAEWWGKNFTGGVIHTKLSLQPMFPVSRRWSAKTRILLSSCTQGNFVPLSLIFLALHSPSKLFYQCLPTTDHNSWLSLSDMAL